MEEFESKTCGSCGKVFATESDFLHDTDQWKICSLGHLWFNCSCHSTLMLKKNKYPWYSPTSKMGETAKGIFNQLSKKDSVPYIRSSALELQQLLSKEDIDLNQIASALKMEPLIAGELLETTRRLNRGDGSMHDIKDIKHAILYSGVKKLRDIVIIAAIKEIKLNSKIFTVENFWEKAFHNAIIVEYLTKKFTPYHNPDEMYLAGFLMEIGKFIQAYYYPEKVDKAFQAHKSPKNELFWGELEKVYQLESYITLGEVACAIWGLPQSVTDCAIGLEEVSSKVGKFIPKNEIACLAGQINNWIHYEVHDVNIKCIESIFEKLSLDKNDIDALANEVKGYIMRFSNNLPLQQNQVV